MPESAEKLASGLTFGRAALDYERGRPDWPAAALEAVPMPHEAEVLDLAAGTGKLTRSLIERYARVVAVEPDDGMRELIDVCDAYQGRAEAIPLPDSSFDAVFVAEAFHWFDGKRALAEIERVLRPRGYLVLLWSEDWQFDPPVPDGVGDVLQDVYRRVGRPGGPLRESGVWKEAFADGAFEPLRERKLSHEVPQTADETVSLWLSISSLASLPERERAGVGRRLRELVDEPRRFRFRVDLYWTRLATG